MVDVRNGQPRPGDDELVTEEPMEVRVVAWRDDRWVQHQVAVTMRTPSHDFELAAGFLFTEGVISDRRAVSYIGYSGDPIANCTDPDKPQKYNVVTVYLEKGVWFDAQRLSRHVYTTSSCGVCGKTSLELVRVAVMQPPIGMVRLPSEYFLRLPGSLRSAQTVFDRTGGLHASALFNENGELLHLDEDVGRHNAVDKLVGSLFLKGRLPASNTVLLVSGRASFELVQKAAMAGIPAMAAVGAPSSLAVQLATEFGMTLIGFLRDGRFNIYSGAERIAMTGVGAS